MFLDFKLYKKVEKSKEMKIGTIISVIGLLMLLFQIFFQINSLLTILSLTIFFIGIILISFAWIKYYK